MNFKDCPDWVCNTQGIPHDYVYALTTLFSAIPFLLLVGYLYNKIHLSATKNQRHLFIILIPIAYSIYSIIIFFSFLESNLTILEFVAIANFPLAILPFTTPLSILGLIIFAIPKIWKMKL